MYSDPDSSMSAEESEFHYQNLVQLNDEKLVAEKMTKIVEIMRRCPILLKNERRLTPSCLNVLQMRTLCTLTLHTHEMFTRH